MKKIAFIALAICHLVCNAYDFKSEGIGYEFVSLTDMTVKAVSGTSELSSEVVIPDEVIYNTRSLKVIGIGDEAFSNIKSITSMTVGDNVTTIGTGAFKNCTSMSKLVIGANVTSLGMNCLNGCTALKELILKDGPKPLDCGLITGTAFRSPFYSAPLVTLHLGRQLPVGTYRSDLSLFGRKATLKNLTFGPNVTTIDDEWFNNCGITEVTIPDNCTLGVYAFQNCYSLKSVTIGNNVTMLQQPFFYCTNLETITFGSGVIAWAAYNKFVQCKNIRKVVSYSTSPISGIEFESDVYVHGEAIVPIGSLQSYKESSTWGQFWNIHEGKDAGIDQPSMDDKIRVIVGENGVTLINANGQNVIIYTSMGTTPMSINDYQGETIALEHGIYIFHIGQTVQKVLI